MRRARRRLLQTLGCHHGCKTRPAHRRRQTPRPARPSQGSLRASGCSAIAVIVPPSWRGGLKWGSARWRPVRDSARSACVRGAAGCGSSAGMPVTVAIWRRVIPPRWSSAGSRGLLASRAEAAGLRRTRWSSGCASWRVPPATRSAAGRPARAAKLTAPLVRELTARDAVQHSRARRLPGNDLRRRQADEERLRHDRRRVSPARRAGSRRQQLAWCRQTAADPLVGCSASCVSFAVWPTGLLLIPSCGTSSAPGAERCTHAN